MMVNGIEVIRDWRQALNLLENDPLIAVDLETGGLRPHMDKIAVVSMYGANTDVLAILHVRGNVPPEVLDFLGRKDKEFIYHNGVGFDIPFLLAAGARADRPKIYDTMVGAGVVITTNRNGQRKSLQAEIDRRLGVYISKDSDHSRWMDAELSPKQISYCAEDLLHLPSLRSEQIEKSKTQNQYSALMMEMELVPIVSLMTHNGLPLSLSTLEDSQQTQRMFLDTVGKQFSDRFGNVNTNSPKQVQALLESLGMIIPMVPNPKKETVKSTAAKVLEGLLVKVEDDNKQQIFDAAMSAIRLVNKGYVANPENFPERIVSIRAKDIADTINNILRLREAHKRLDMYDQEWLEKYVHNGFIHSRFWQVGTDTGRFCVSPDTLVEVPRDLSEYPDGVPLRDLRVGQLVYSYNYDGDLCLRPIKWIGPTGIKPTLRITLWNEKEKKEQILIITKDHLCMMLNGDWRMAGKLRIGDHLRSMLHRSERDGYPAFSGRTEQLHRTETQGVTLEHHMVYKNVTNDWEINGRYHVIHHKDENKANVTPENLVKLSREDHTRLHNTQISMREVLQAVLDPSTWQHHPKTLWRMAKMHDIEMSLPYDWKKQIPTNAEYRKSEKTLGWGKVNAATDAGSKRNYVVSKIEEGETIECWDLEVEDTHAFIGSGVCLHNSSTEPNLQQWPRDFRGVIGNLEGHSIVSCDYSQLEVVVSAWISQDKALLQMIESGGDIHTLIASQIFGVPVSSIGKASKERQVAKACSFCLLFGGGAQTLMEYALNFGAVITLEEARDIVKRFFRQFRGAAADRQRAYDMAKQTKGVVELRLVNGLTRHLVGEKILPTTILNTRVQGNAAIGMKYALLEAKRKGLHKYLGATVHDELVACVPEKWAEEYGKELEKVMIKGMSNVVGCTIRCHATVGKVWGK